MIYDEISFLHNYTFLYIMVMIGQKHVSKCLHADHLLSISLHRHCESGHCYRYQLLLFSVRNCYTYM